MVVGANVPSSLGSSAPISGERRRPIGAANRDLVACFAESEGVDGRDFVSSSTHDWLGGLASQLPNRFWIHRDAAADRAARLLGAGAFALGNRIFLRSMPESRIEAVLRHELVHLAQVQLARNGAPIAPRQWVESEAERLAALPVACPARLGADPEQPYRVVWFVAIGIGAYILLRPGVANAPGPEDPVYDSPSMCQIVGEAVAIFAIPGGAYAVGGRLGFGFLGSMALAGASGNVSLRAVDDASRGELSPPSMYIFDATTGAVIGFVVPGGFRLIGRAGTWSLDRLATYGLRNSDIAVTRLLAQEAVTAPLTATRAQQILQSRGMGGQVSQWWLNRRGIILLYRGQDVATSQILSPIARQQGVAASEAMVMRMRAAGLGDNEIAGYVARWHTQGVPAALAPPGLGGQPLGGVGIPTTRIPGIAANFGDEGVIYIMRVPKSAAIQPQGWQGLHLEDEFVILNQMPEGTIVNTIPARSVAPIKIDGMGQIVPGG